MLLIAGIRVIGSRFGATSGAESGWLGLLARTSQRVAVDPVQSKTHLPSRDRVTPLRREGGGEKASRCLAGKSSSTAPGG
jgi:hypothetical protein